MDYPNLKEKTRREIFDRMSEKASNKPKKILTMEELAREVSRG